MLRFVIPRRDLDMSTALCKCVDGSNTLPVPNLLTDSASALLEARTDSRTLKIHANFFSLFRSTLIFFSAEKGDLLDQA